MRRHDLAFLMMGGLASIAGIAGCRDHHEDILVDAAVTDAKPDVQNTGGVGGGAAGGIGGGSAGGGTGVGGTTGSAGAGGAGGGS